jgi:hypothetical protein
MIISFPEKNTGTYVFLPQALVTSADFGYPI